MKRQQYYKDLIASLEKADTHMKKTIEDATGLMNRVVVVDQEVELKTETITKSIIDDTIMFDLEEKKEPEMAQTLNVDEMGDNDILQQNELSFLSANVSANSCYFQNTRHMENSQVCQLKNKHYVFYDSMKKTNNSVGMCDRYHVSMAILPGKGECMVVGGTADAEGKMPMDTV